MPTINPEMLIWARENTGLSLEEAALKLGLKDNKKWTAAEHLSSYEKGEHNPSQSFLNTASNCYKQPLLSFYLATPLQKADRGKDFRSLPSRTYITIEDYHLDTIIKDIQSRQAIVRAIIEDEDELEHLDFINSISLKSDISDTVEFIRKRFDLNLNEFRSKKNIDAAFGYLRDKIEKTGVFVVLTSNLGTHHTDVGVSSFRGYAISDPFAPFILINSKDVRVSWSFTALHELVHLLLGETGISGLRLEATIEQFCNDIASSFLLHDDELDEIEILDSDELNDTKKKIRSFATPRFISPSLVAYRLYKSRIISHEFWSQIRNSLHDDWARLNSVTPDSEEKKKDGPSYYVVKRQRLGKRLLDFVDQSLKNGQLTPTKAGIVLQVKPRNVKPLLEFSPTTNKKVKS